MHDQLLGRDSIIGWNLNQPEKHDGIEYWFIQGYVSKGMFKEPHAVDEFQKLKPIIKSPPVIECAEKLRLAKAK